MPSRPTGGPLVALARRRWTACWARSSCRPGPVQLPAGGTSPGGSAWSCSRAGRDGGNTLMRRRRRPAECGSSRACPGSPAAVG
jgi:hypothetical protein